MNYSSFARRCWYLFLIIIILRPFVGLAGKGELVGSEENSEIDPIAFSFTADRSVVKVGEELELTIVAVKREALDVRLYVWLDTDFRIKVVLPDGFIQTGGNYQDYIGEKLSGSKKRVSYKLRGKFIKIPSDNTFMLLRWGKNAEEENRFVIRGRLGIEVRDVKEANNSARIAASCGAGGSFDAADCNSISGWIWDHSLPNTPLSIDLYEGNTLIQGNILANNFRQDLLNAGIGNGEHGFSFPTPSQLKNGQNRVLTFRVSGCSTEASLGGTPKTINCPSVSGCNFTPSISSTNNNPQVNGTFTLNASCTGADCSGVTYTWSGNGISGTGASKQVTAPASAGAYTYTVTASRSGCANKTANIPISVSAVSAPVVTLSIWKAGTAGVRSKVKDIVNGETIQISTLGGSQMNYFIDISNGQISNTPGGNNYSHVSLYLNGPGYSNQGWGPEDITAAGSPPFGLFGKDGGGAPAAGSYTLTGKIFQGTTELSSKTVSFSLADASCNFTPTISSSNDSPGPGTNFTLTAGCTGGDCSGVTYTWSGNGISGTGTTKSVTAPSAYGTYTYTVTASKSSCSSKTASKPIVVEDPNATVSPVILTKGYSSLMDIQITGTNGNWVINDLATRTPASGYEWWYIVGSKTVKRSTPLSNEPWKGNHPGRILKFSTKIGLETLNRWGPGGGYYDNEAGQLFDKGDVGASTTFMFKNAPAVAGTSLNWRTAIPNNWNPGTQMPQWADINPNMTLPSSKVYFYQPNNSAWTITQAMQKGVTHWESTWAETEGGESVFLSNPAYAKKKAYFVPQIRNIFGLSYQNGSWWPNGFYNESQARAKGQSVPITPRLWIGETMEGEDYVPEGHPMWNWFYEELKNRYEVQKANDGIQYYLAHNYFNRWGGNDSDRFSIVSHSMSLSDVQYREHLYNTPVSNWPANYYSPGGNLQHTNTIIHGIYINVPDYQHMGLFDAMYGMELAKKMGKFTGVCAFNWNEWSPGFAQNTYLSNGTLERSDKTPLDPNIQIALPFITMEFGDIYSSWGLVGKMRNDINKILDLATVTSQMAGKDRWYPNNQGAPSDDPYPNYVKVGTAEYATQGYYIPGSYMGDLPTFGMRLWNETAGQVEGGTVYYCSYKLNNDAWVERKANGSDLLYAYYERRGFARVRIKNNKACVYYFNPFADNEARTIQIKHPTNSSIIWTGTVSGNGIHAVVVDL